MATDVSCHTWLTRHVGTQTGKIPAEPGRRWRVGLGLQIFGAHSETAFTYSIYRKGLVHTLKL